MSEEIETPFGKLRHLGPINREHPEGGPMSEYLWTCPECGDKARLSQKQFEGGISIDCTRYQNGQPTGCSWHQTHDFRPFIAGEKR